MPKIIILHSPDWHEGIIGLIASKIAEKFYRPVIVMSEGDGQLKGSARSIPAFHITDFFASNKEFFMNFGGHRQAAGFTIKKEKLEKFKKEAVKQAAKLITDDDLQRVLEADLKVPISAINITIAKYLEQLQPFGVGNMQPIFVSDVEIHDTKLMGKSNNHLKLSVKDPQQHSYPFEMVAFGEGDHFTSLTKGQQIQVVYQVDINRWNGRERVQGKVMEMVY